MKKIIVVIFLINAGLVVTAQDSSGKTAKNYIREGDYNNAILVLNRAIENDNDNIDLKKDLAYAYYLQRDYSKAITAIRPVVESREADEQSFQILGLIYKAIEQRKEADKLYRTALRKFPQSGVLYNEFGELLWANTDFTGAVKQWQRGIQTDPNYSGNYYNAARYYYMTTDKVWGLLYGEIFVNLESYSKRTPEIKTMLVEGYKKLFSDTDIFKTQDTKNEFVRSYLEIMKELSPLAASGITPDALSALRTRFILKWYEKELGKFPFRLFDYHRQLARSGLFDAYNQWIFGAASNLSLFQQWTVTHTEEYNRFNAFQRSRVFKLPDDQYYFRSQ